MTALSTEPPPLPLSLKSFSVSFFSPSNCFFSVVTSPIVSLFLPLSFYSLKKPNDIKEMSNEIYEVFASECFLELHWPQHDTVVHKIIIKLEEVTTKSYFLLALSKLSCAHE